MEIFEALERDAAAVGRDITGAFRRRHTSAAQPAAAVTITSSATQGDPVTNNFFADLKADGHAFLEKLDTVDEAAVGVVEAIKVNPTAISITNTLASIAHLPDPQGLLSSADVLLKSFALALSKGEQDTAPAAAEASFTPAGPQVAGQA